MEIPILRPPRLVPHTSNPHNIPPAKYMLPTTKFLHVKPSQRPEITRPCRDGSEALIRNALSRNNMPRWRLTSSWHMGPLSLDCRCPPPRDYHCIKLLCTAKLGHVPYFSSSLCQVVCWEHLVFFSLHHSDINSSRARSVRVADFSNRRSWDFAARLPDPLNSICLECEDPENWTKLTLTA